MEVDDKNDDYPSPRRRSIHSFDGHLSPVIPNNETLDEIKPLPKPRQPISQIPRLKNSKKLSTSMIIIDNKSSALKTR
jgi:hypothetical protein